GCSSSGDRQGSVHARGTVRGGLPHNDRFGIGGTIVVPAIGRAGWTARGQGVDGGEKLGHFGGVEISHGVGYALAFSKPDKRQGGRHGFTSKLSLRLRPPRPVEPAKRDTICR